MNSQNPFHNQSDGSSRVVELDLRTPQEQTAFNPQMLVIAREARGLTQKELAEKIGVAQGTVSKLEDGLLIPSEELLSKLAGALDFPTHFFLLQRRIEWANVGLYRRRVTMPASLLRQSEAKMNIIKLNVTQLLSAAEPIQTRLPHLDPDEHGGAKNVAQIMRNVLKLPPGPVRNLTDALEAAGCIIIPFDFGTKKIDGCSMFVGDVPVLFISNSLNAVRYRLTIAHETAHLVMHRTPTDSEEQEDQANRFASELLMPEDEIKATLLPINIDRLARHKLRWRVSMQAIIYHAKSIGVITERTARYHFSVINRLGYRESEPYDNDIPKESPRLLRELIDMHLQDLAATTSSLANDLGISETDFAAWFLGRPRFTVLENDASVL